MWVFDRTTLKFLVVNQAAVKRYGFSLHDFMSLSILDIRPLEDISKVLHATIHPHSHDVGPRRWTHVAKDGTVFAADVTSYEMVFEGRPAELVIAEVVPPKAEATYITSKHSVNGCEVKILIADDDPLFRALLVKSLPADIEPVCADEGYGAWARLTSEDHPAIAILDWVMPGLTGLDICRRVRSTPKTRNVYVILLTAKTALEDFALGIAAGADDFMSKPFKPEDVRFRIKLARQTVVRRQG